MSDKRVVYDVNEFCSIHRISRGKFYDLVKKGVGPELMRLDRRTLITEEAAAEWRKKMTTQGIDRCRSRKRSADQSGRNT